MGRFIHAFKPTVCAVFGSRQSTGRRLDRELSGVLAINRHGQIYLRGRPARMRHCLLPSVNLYEP
jgi:hypothetical protein